MFCGIPAASSTDRFSLLLIQIFYLKMEKQTKFELFWTRLLQNKSTR